MNLSESHLRVLLALRAMADVKREPKTLTPDGHQIWWSLAELEEYVPALVGEPLMARLSAAARTLRRHHLIDGRTQFTVTRYAITDEGRALLARLEDDARLGGTIHVAWTQSLQAIEDIRRAEAAYDKAADALQEAKSAERAVRAVRRNAREELGGGPLAAAILGRLLATREERMR